MGLQESKALTRRDIDLAQVRADRFRQWGQRAYVAGWPRIADQGFEHAETFCVNLAHGVVVAPGFRICQEGGDRSDVSASLGEAGGEGQLRDPQLGDVAEFARQPVV